MSRWPRLTRLLLLIGIMLIASWAGMSYVRGNMTAYFLLWLIASMLAATIHLSPPPKPSKE